MINALPHPALVANSVGRIVLRNAEAQTLLPAGEDINGVLNCDGPITVHWEAEMAALVEGAGRVVRRNVSLVGRGDRRLLVDMYLRGMGLCLAVCDEGAEGDGRACRLAISPSEAEARPSERAGRECILVLLQDVTPRVSTERRLAAGERLAATGVLAAKVAHELNNPLDGAMRFIGLAERVCGERAREYLANARGGLMRMAEIIRGLLEQGRPWQGAGERVSVQRLLEEAVTTMQPRAQALGVAVVSDLDGQVDGTVEGAVFQVFCNVIKNALDAMPGGGRLTIRVRAAGEQCRIDFDDTGCGLTDEEAERIFEPFHTTKPPAEGSGLGLTICREIITRASGTIAASARAAGGVRVTIRLPLRPKW